MRPPTVREAKKRLEAEGFKRTRVRGSHARYEKEGRKVTLAGKDKDTLAPATWEAIKKQAGWL